MSAHALGHILASHAKISQNSKSQKTKFQHRLIPTVFKESASLKQELIWAQFISSFCSPTRSCQKPISKPQLSSGVSGLSSSCHEGSWVQQKMGKAQQCKWGSGEVSGWVVKQISNILHKALTMRNVFIIICSLLETCRFQSLRHSLAVTGVILAVIVQLDLLVFWIHYRPFKDGVHSYNNLYPLRAWLFMKFSSLSSRREDN